MVEETSRAVHSPEQGQAPDLEGRQELTYTLCISYL